MSTFTIAPVAITANVQKNSAGQALPAGINTAKVQLSDSAGRVGGLSTNSNWLKTVGNITKWGIQRSNNNGVTWTEPDGGWFLSQTGLPFGSVDGGGGMPTLTLSGQQLISAQGDQLRLAIITDSNITLGAVITTS